MPELTEERRKALTKQVKSRAEEAKVAVHNIRRDSNDAAKKAKKESLITEDDLSDMLESIQKLTDEHIKKIEWYRTPVEKKLGSFSYFNGWIDEHPIGNMDLNQYKYKRKMGFDIIYK